MYDINTKNVRKGKNIWFLFFGLGILFFVVILFGFISSMNKLNSLDSTVMSSNVEIKSHINDEGNVMYSAVYYYIVDGKQYICGSNVSSSMMPSTENKTVYYDSNNPASCMSESSKTGNYIFLAFLIIPIIFIIISIFCFINIKKKIKIIEELNQKGKLVKSLPYRLEDTGRVVNGVRIKRPVVDYVLPTGNVITLYGDPRNDRKTMDADGLVDLLIDESNPKNYYIDFEINRLTGNLPEDYNQNNYPQYQQTNYSNQSFMNQYTQFVQPQNQSINQTDQNSNN